MLNDSEGKIGFRQVFLIGYFLLLGERLETNGKTSSEVGWRGGRPEGRAERPARRAVGSRVLVHGVLDQVSQGLAHAVWLFTKPGNHFLW